MVNMYKKIKKMMRTEAFLYLIFGVLTTIVNYGIFIVGLEVTHQDRTLLVNFVAFCGATLFAFLTNKAFVFRSPNWEFRKISVELCEFVGARVFSLCIEQLGLLIAIEWFQVEYYNIGLVDGLIVSKVVLSLVSVLINYFASKFLVFGKEKK